MIEYMIVIIAWVVAPVMTLNFISVTHQAMTYPGSLEETLDRGIRGHKKIFSPMKPGFVALIAWAYIIAFYFS